MSEPPTKRQGFLTFHIVPVAKVPYLRPPNFVHIGPTCNEIRQHGLNSSAI